MDQMVPAPEWTVGSNINGQGRRKTTDYQNDVLSNCRTVKWLIVKLVKSLSIFYLEQLCTNKQTWNKKSYWINQSLDSFLLHCSILVSIICCKFTEVLKLWKCWLVSKFHLRAPSSLWILCPTDTGGSLLHAQASQQEYAQNIQYTKIQTRNWKNINVNTLNPHDCQWLAHVQNWESVVLDNWQKGATLSSRPHQKNIKALIPPQVNIYNLHIYICERKKRWGCSRHLNSM